MDKENLYIVGVNYLAHAYLSFGNAEIAVGNLISDFVKGKKKLDYPAVVQQGIALHRAIDQFTDTHPVTRQAMLYFKPDYGLYAGPLTDVVYDHFLANDPIIFPTEDTSGARTLVGDQARIGQPPSPALADFAREIYRQVGGHASLFPDRFARIFPYMQSQNWLYNYRYKEGIFNSFSGLHRRAAYMPEPEMACRLFEKYYEELNACYTAFFPALRNFALNRLQELTGNSGSGKIE